ncbi:MFS general substrate transporter [Crassisporium funariophilum]|nr:MFS general substrate transporter [Crassisporium funariophilum]
MSKLEQPEGTSSLKTAELSIDDKHTDAGNVKFDRHGLPLLPQPTESLLDPLNYPNWLKYTILAQASFLAFLSTLNTAIINPAVVPLADEFNIARVTATYQTTVAIGTSALGPLVFTPFADVYGRRPAYLVSILIGFVSALGAAKATSYGTLILARAINGIGASAALGLGAGTVVDVFYMHQRGKAMGIFTLMQTNGAHLAPIIGGYVARDRGWRWCFWVGAILNAVMFIFIFFLMPETLFHRPAEDVADMDVLDDIAHDGEKASLPGTQVEYTPPPMDKKSYLRRLWFWDLDRPASRRMKGTDFVVKPLSMLKYPSVLFPAIYYAFTYGFASIEPALTLATIFTQLYHFDTVRNGLANGVSLLVGASLGELCSGPVTDGMMLRARRRALQSGETVPAEVRLRGIWTGAILVPVGLIMYGVTVHFATTFIAPCIGMAVACFGIQIVTSVCYTYSCSDCYRSRSNDVSQCFNFLRQVFGLTLGFYSIPFGERIGYQWSFTVFAAICSISFLPIVVLMYRGEKWRKALGYPTSF